MNPESLMHERGSVAIVVHKDRLDRREKDALRESSELVQAGPYFMLLINEEPENDEQVFDVGTYDDPEAQVVVPNTQQDDEPTMADLFGEMTMDALRSLSVTALRRLADSEKVDLAGLKLKDDILGRMAAHFGLDPAE